MGSYSVFAGLSQQSDISFSNFAAAVEEPGAVKMLSLCTVITVFPSEQCYSLFVHQVRNRFAATAMQMLPAKLRFILLQ